MNPAYPGGFEILAAGRPDVVVLQHAPARRAYDGFDPAKVARAIELSAEKYCSASAMLGKTAEITHDFEIREG